MSTNNNMAPSGSSSAYSWEYRGVELDFPIPPYDCQKTLTERALDCLMDGHDGAVESPTGTGKTLALLSAALGWLKQGRMTKIDTGAAGHLFYSSRTHGQLSQAMRQLKAAVATSEALSGVTAVALGSRDALCLHPKVRERTSQAEKNQLCKFLVKGGQCEYYNNFSGYSQNRSGGCGMAQGEVMDIEDLVKSNAKKRMCPYYLSRDLAPKADLVFLPYNYLLDDRIRRSLPLPLRGSAAIVDEAHNVAQVCEDVASLSFTAQDLALAISDVDAIIKLLQAGEESQSELAKEVLPENLTLPDVAELKEFAVKLEVQFLLFQEGSSNTGEKFLLTVMECAGGLHSQLASLSGVLDRVLEAAGTLDGLGAKNIGRGLHCINDIISLVHTVDGATLKEHYTFLRTKNSSSFEGRSSFGFSRGSHFQLWCFTPSVAWRAIRSTGLRSMVMASGTLHPLSQFAADFDAPFPVQFTGSHVIDSAKQVLVRVLPKGHAGEMLVGSYANRDNPKYVDSLGRTISKVVRHVPNGAIVFMPSYAVLDRLVSAWKTSGVWNELSKEKEIFVEPRDKRVFPSLLANFTQKAEQASGALLLGVCRGKISEGIDFTDKMARAVFITGLPFPNVKDERVKLKMQHEDRTGGGSGNQWYKMQAYRAVNQAVGRVIRGKHDYGAVYFLDTRFADESVLNSLSEWMRGQAKKSMELDEAIRDTRAFFSRNALHSQTSNAVAAVSSMCNSSNQRDQARVLQSATNKDLKTKQVTGTKRKLVVSSSAANKVLKYKAGNIINDIKECLSKEDMKQFKSSLKAYKDNHELQAFLDVILGLKQRGCITSDHINKLGDFVHEGDKKKFFMFASGL